MINDKSKVKRNFLIVGGLILLILLFDQLLKIYIKNNFLPGESRPMFGEWFVLEFTENPGMAFGTTFGGKVWHKLALSIFRIVAVTVLCWYWVKQVKKAVRLEFLIALGLIIAGATGNLLDSMFYDFTFKYDPCFPYNIREGSGIFVECDFWGKMETRPRGFLMGNVVDMFKFEATWPSWMPWLAGEPVFPAIWNVADGSITLGVIMIFIRQGKYFPKEKKVVEAQEISLEDDSVVSDEISEEKTPD